MAFLIISFAAGAVAAAPAPMPSAAPRSADMAPAVDDAALAALLVKAAANNPQIAAAAQKMCIRDSQYSFRRIPLFSVQNGISFLRTRRSSS